MAKILLVEDDELLVKTLMDQFKIDQFETLHAQDGQAGLELALKEHPDVILLDILMPGMDGISMLRSLRGDEWGKTAPVILLTNVSPDTDKTLQNIMELKPSFYLVKGKMTVEEVVNKVKEVLGAV